MGERGLGVFEMLAGTGSIETWIEVLIFLGGPIVVGILVTATVAHSRGVGWRDFRGVRWW